MGTRATFLFLLIVYTIPARSQTCTNLGQNPGTAFPVCGSSVFTQSNVAICGQRAVPSQCSGSLFTDKNPYWYKFTCFVPGSLAFAITPNNLSDDYDWQLFDVTNHNPADVYTDASLFVACNWSGDGGVTGASTSGSSLTVCEGSGRPLFSRSPNLIQDHNYLLLVSHFTNTQSGYSLSFGGGTSSIKDTTTGKLQTARISCDGLKINISLTKKMKCSSLAADGSDLPFHPPYQTLQALPGLIVGVASIWIRSPSHSIILYRRATTPSLQKMVLIIIHCSIIAMYQCLRATALLSMYFHYNPRRWIV